MPELGPERVDQPAAAGPEVRPEAEVMAEGAAQAAAVERLEGEHAALEDPERRCADIKLWVEAECDYFGIEPKNDPVADQLTQILFAHEVKQLDRGRGDYDITTEERRRLDRVVERGFSLGADEAAIADASEVVEAEAEETDVIAAQADTEAEVREEVETDASAYEALLQSPEYLQKSNVDKIAMMTGHPDVPESEKAKWASFGRIMAIADRVPTDAPIIRQRLNQLDMSQGVPDPVQFIQTAIFSSSDIDTGVSAATQEAIAAEFGLTPQRVVTGSDFEDALNTTVTNEDGEPLPAYTDEQPLQFGVGLDGYTDADGETQYMRATPEHGHGVTLEVTSLSPQEKAILASYLDTWRMTEDAGASEWLLSLTQYDLHGSNVVDPLQLIEAAQVVNAVYGGFAGYNGEVLRGAEQIGMIQWQAQLASPKGDAARSDRNSSMTESAMVGLGIQDETGRVDLDVLRAFGEYSRENWFSAPDYNAVQTHLVALFPEKFETSR